MMVINNVIVWGSFSWCGVGPLHRIQGTMDQHMYKEILENVMLPYAEENLPLVRKFQQDNDPKHTAKSVKMWFNAKKINIYCIGVARTVTRPKSDRKFVGGS